MILFLVIFSLALSGGLGAPTAVYKFVKCNPDGDQANCITHQSETMEWSPDLAAKLPATEAQYLEAEPVADERDPEDEDVLQEEFLSPEEGESPEAYLPEEGESPEPYLPEEGESPEPYLPEEGESPEAYLPEEGSGDEGSAFIADWATPADTGSGELLAKNYKPQKGGRAFWSLLDEKKPAEEDMKKDHLLHL